MHELDHFRKLQYSYEIVASDKEYSLCQCLGKADKRAEN